MVPIIYTIYKKIMLYFALQRSWSCHRQCGCLSFTLFEAFFFGQHQSSDPPSLNNSRFFVRFRTNAALPETIFMLQELVIRFVTEELVNL